MTGVKRKTMSQQVGGINATAVLMRKSVLDFNDFSATISDGVDELLGQKIAFQLISSVYTDSAGNGAVSSPAYLEDWNMTLPSLVTGESAYKVRFNWNQQEFGVPGAFIVKNFHHAEFYLRTLTLEDIPGHGRVHFVCNSWVYPDQKYEKDRVFFSNQSYVPGETPAPLIKYRNDELAVLRGNGTRELQEWDRVYDYALYNDLGDPEKGPDFVRPILGGSSEYPYPRRGRTGRPPTKTDPNTEQRIPPIQFFNIYVPRDERFGHLKMSDFVAYGLQAIGQLLLPMLGDLSDHTPDEFDSFEDSLRLYKKGIQLQNNSLFKHNVESNSLEFLKDFLRCDGEGYFRFPTPEVIKENIYAWSTDEEFCREMLAGSNPITLKRIEEFPPQSKLDPKVYGNHTSTITLEQIEDKLDGLTVNNAIEDNRLFILDYNDTLMPYLRRINSTSTKTYASRTLVFLQKDGTLRPLAIELSLPHPSGDEHGAISKVYTPAKNGVEGSVWQLAKSYVAVNDSSIHLLISHWLRTHCVIEPIIIASNRQLSAMHPIYKLLSPHFRDTMNINALSRQALINAGGGIEKAVFPGKFTMEISAVMYKDWVFPEQALPADLIKRGMAVDDPNAPHGLRLLIEDYPFAVDGLMIWTAIQTWVEDYCRVYYKTNEDIQKDTELQSWWKELIEKGHGDKKDEPWWPKMQTLDDLIHSCTIIIWTASALHAAVNFGQYAYGGYLPNRPTISRRFMPEPGTPEYDELRVNPDKVFFRTITAQQQTLVVMSLIETLSRHASDEVYLGQRDTPGWTKDAGALQAFEKFGENLGEIEKRILQLNNDCKNKNRVGPVNMPYTLLYPSSGPGVTGKGIPNSASI